MKFQVMLKRGYSAKGANGLPERYEQNEIIECDEDLAARFNTDSRNGVKFRPVGSHVKAKYEDTTPQSVVENVEVDSDSIESDE